MKRLVFFVCALAACSSNNDSSSDAAVHDASALVDASSSGDGALLPDAGECVAIASPAIAAPIDLFVMLDQSGSMTDNISTGGSKWDAVTTAIDAFTQETDLGDVSLGLQYFAAVGSTCSVKTCQADADCGAGCGPCLTGLCAGYGQTIDSCNASDYAMPAVEIAPLPSAAIGMSIAGHTPSTETPLGPALQGAVDHASTWATAHAGHFVAAILVTDGTADECTPTDTPGTAQIAATALSGSPSIQTFGIGTFEASDIPSGPMLLDAIAAAGGTTVGYDIATTGNVSASVQAALEQVRSKAAACNFGLPAGADAAHVNVTYTPNGGAAQTIVSVTNATSCPMGSDGWYYDNAVLTLCPSTCTKIVADAMAKPQLVVGCPTTH